MDTVFLDNSTTFVSVVILKIKIPAIYLFSDILILWNDVSVLVVIYNSNTKDDVLKLAVIENINMSLMAKRTTRGVLIVETVLVF